MIINRVLEYPPGFYPLKESFFHRFSFIEKPSAETGFRISIKEERRKEVSLKVGGVGGGADSI
jgi:hypothetical protein